MKSYVNPSHRLCILFSSDCVKLQDPYCAWDPKQTSCVSLDVATDDHYLIQDVVTGDENKCWQISKLQYIILCKHFKSLRLSLPSQILVISLEENLVERKYVFAN